MINRFLKKALKLVSFGIFSSSVVSASCINHYEKAMQLWKKEKYEEAIIEFDNAIEADQNKSSSLLNKGVLLSQLERYKDALAAYNVLIEIEPDYGVAYSNRGNVLSKLDKFQDAINSYNKAIELSIKYTPHPYIASIRIGIGETLMNMNKLPEALEEFKAAIENDPDSAGAYFNKGAVLTKMFRPKPEIIEAFDMAIKLRPEFPEAYFFRGVELLELDKFEDAINSFNKAIHYDPNNPQYYYFKALALNTIGKELEAKKLLKKVDELGGYKSK